jgi:hypothetical protein
MNMRLASVFSGMVLALAAAPALAQQQPMVNTPPAMASNTNIAGFGMAGCGLGSMLFGKQTGMIQILAATTNGVFGSQTFGISSGTSNCTDAGGGMASTKSFVETNKEALAKDISRGQGETIIGLSALAGCTDNKQVGTFLQSNYSSLFPNATVSGKQAADNVVQSLKANPQLSCKNLI